MLVLDLLVGMREIGKPAGSCKDTHCLILANAFAVRLHETLESKHAPLWLDAAV